MNKVKGFTLIELLVVMSIVSLLSSVVITFLQAARLKGQDSHTIQSIRQLQMALLMYNEKFQTYPSAYPPGVDVGDWNGSTSFETTLRPLVDKGFVAKIPHHPNYPNNPNYSDGFFEYQTDPTISPLPSNYKLMCGEKLFENEPYIILIAHPRKLNLPHLRHLNPDNTITDDYDAWFNYYYCVAPL